MTHNMDLALFGGGQVGLPELIVVLLVILLMFGAKKLPELARSLGKSLSEFKKGKEDGERATDDSQKPKETPQQTEAKKGNDGCGSTG